MSRPASLSSTAALLLVLATIVFVIGVMAERSIAGEDSESRPSEAVTVSSSEEAGEAAEGGTEIHEDEAAEGKEEGAQADEATEPHLEANETSETLFGINPESTSAVAAAVVISLILAAALWFWGAPAVLVVTAVVALLFAVFDLREVAHQLSEARSSLVVVALLAALLHAGAAVVAGLALTRSTAST